MIEPVLREASLAELPRIAPLKRQIHSLHAQGRPDFFVPDMPPDSLGEVAAQNGMRLLLAECGGQAAGYALIRFVNRPANPYMKERRFVHVEEFCVEQRFRRQGIGRALMAFVRQFARENGYTRIELDVWSFNEEALRFYEALGLQTYRRFLEMDV